MIRTFADAFEYVGKHYAFNKYKHPTILKLSRDEALTFMLTHVLKHLIMCNGRLKEPRRTLESEFARLPFVRIHGKAFSEQERCYRDTVLNIAVYVMFTAHLLEFTQEEIASYHIPSEDEMSALIPGKSVHGLAPTFKDSVLFLIEELATLTAQAEHPTKEHPDCAGKVNTDRLCISVKASYLCLLHWHGNDSEMPARISEAVSRVLSTS